MKDYIVFPKEKLSESRQQLQTLKQHPFRNRKKIRNLKIKIQAYEEGQRNDVLTPSATNGTTSQGNIDKNNYGTYSGQVTEINEMYNNRTNYGGELLRSVLSTRVSLIAGGNISIIPLEDNEKADKTIKWIKSFFKFNKFHSFRLLENVLISEMEGKDLLVISSNNKFKNIRIRNYSWYITPYEVTMSDKDNQKIEKVTYQKNIEAAATEIAKPENLVYVKIGGSPDRINNTVPLVANCLTDIENVSRAKYDLRKNNHLFGKSFLHFKTQTEKEAKAINNSIQGNNWVIGKSYAGTADTKYIEPGGKASDVLKEEIIIGMKNISLNTGIPVQLLAYPELLSNRATAENMLEMTNAATIKEREIWQDALTELIQKAMAMAFEKGYIDFNEPDIFEIRLPLISYANLKQIQETWIPLADGDFISTDTVRNIIPGIDPIKEKRIIEEQKNENINRMMNNLQKDLTDKDSDDKEEEEEENENEDSGTNSKQ